MIFSSEILTRIIIFVLGLCGFLVAKHIYNHKKYQTPLVCPMKFDCHAVIHSDYSKFLGIPVETFGMTYYALVAVAYLPLIFFGNLVPANLISFLVMASLAAFLFSIYLISVQIFILKKGCSWCIVSALLCFCIFILTSI